MSQSAGFMKNWIMEGFFEPEDGYECMNKNSCIRQPTYRRILLGNDVMALGAISAITEKAARLMISRLLAMIIFTHHVSMHPHSQRFTNRSLV